MKELKPPFKVGDKIKFKTWNAMIKEYGKNPFNNPDIYYGMPREMYNDYKNTVFTVKEITLNDNIWDIKTEEPHSCCFQSQMFKLVKSKKTTKEKISESKCKFKIGDKVRIRTWDDMAKEFGGTIDSIDVPCRFIRHMEEELSGKVFTIKDIIYTTCLRAYKIIFEEPCFWNISEQMCELAEPKKKTTKSKDSSFFTEEEQVKILNALEVIISKIKD